MSEKTDEISTTNVEGVLVDGTRLMALEMDESKIESLIRYQQLLEKWNKVYNLSSITHPLDVVRLHLLDSLSLAKFISGGRIADVGTGAGFPGIPLAIYWNDKAFFLIDSNSKKTRFVQQAIIELNLANVEILHGRAEEVELDPKVDIILTRAFASLTKTMAMTKHLLVPGGKVFAMKGSLPIDELKYFSKERFSYEALDVPGVDADRYLIRLVP